MKTKVLILGGGGFIGINIARELMKSSPKYDLTLADQGFFGRLEEYFPDPEERSMLKVIEADFSSGDSYRLLDDDYDHVYMLAAVVGVNRTLSEPEEVIRINTALVHHTLAWLKGSRVKKILFASSSENYAATTDLFDYPIPTDEDVPLCVSDIRHPRWT